MEQSFEELAPEFAALCRRYHIERLSLFGSAARGEMSADSDIDLLVEFEVGRAPSLAGFEHLRKDLEELLSVKRVDIATPSILRNPYRRRAILADLKALYAA